MLRSRVLGVGRDNSMLSNPSRTQRPSASSWLRLSTSVQNIQRSSKGLCARPRQDLANDQPVVEQRGEDQAEKGQSKRPEQQLWPREIHVPTVSRLHDKLERGQGVGEAGRDGHAPDGGGGAGDQYILLDRQLGNAEDSRECLEECESKQRRCEVALVAVSRLKAVVHVGQVGQDPNHAACCHGPGAEACPGHHAAGSVDKLRSCGAII